jgi:hypothetical protein
MRGVADDHFEIFLVGAGERLIANVRVERGIAEDDLARRRWDQGCGEAVGLIVGESGIELGGFSSRSSPATGMMVADSPCLEPLTAMNREQPSGFGENVSKAPHADRRKIPLALIAGDKHQVATSCKPDWLLR